MFQTRSGTGLDIEKGKMLPEGGHPPFFIVKDEQRGDKQHLCLITES